MNKIKETLWTEYGQIKDLIKVTDVSDVRYKFLLEERDKVRSEIIKIEQTTMETGLKREVMEAENNRERIRNNITIGTFVITTSVSVYAIIKTFKFDQVATVTSTLGRNILSSVVPKMFKR